MEELMPEASLAFTPVSEGTLRVHLRGEFDLNTAAGIQHDLDHLLEREERIALLDAAAVSFMDSSGVAILIRLTNHFESVTLERPSAQLRQVIEMLGLGPLLHLESAK